MPRSSQLTFDFVMDHRRGRRPSPKQQESNSPPPQSPQTPRQHNVETSPEAVADQQPRKVLAGFDNDLTELAKGWSRDLAMNDLAASVRVTWNPRLKTTAGTACPRNNTIDLNCKIEPFGEAVVLRILKHELAHLVAHRRAGRRRIAAHGMEWRQACTELGIPGEKSRHTLPLASSPQRRKFAYQCPECEEVVLRVRKLARYSACWSCCKAHNRGKYAERFQLASIPLEKGVLLAAIQERVKTDPAS